MKIFTANRESGFSIIEALVATMAFSILIIAVGTTFSQALKIQKKSNATQKVQENMLYVFELIAREIRVSTVMNQDISCNGVPGSTTLSITHPVNGLVTYSLVAGAIRRTAGGTTTNLTSSEVNIAKLNFCVFGSSPTDNRQVRIAIAATVENVTTILNDKIASKIQTTVSTRDTNTESQ